MHRKLDSPEGVKTPTGMSVTDPKYLVAVSELSVPPYSWSTLSRSYKNKIYRIKMYMGHQASCFRTEAHHLSAWGYEETSLVDTLWHNCPFRVVTPFPELSDRGHCQRQDTTLVTTLIWSSVVIFVFLAERWNASHYSSFICLWNSRK